MRLRDVIAFLDRFAPRELSEPWDNVGLLLGDRDIDVERVMTCLTLSPDVAAEAIRDGAEFIVAHHPILFRPVKQLTADTADGRMLLNLIKAGIAVYSPHTAFDSTARGINALLCERLALKDVQPLRPVQSDSSRLASQLIGSGRFGSLTDPVDFAAFVATVRRNFKLTELEVVPTEKPISKVAVACGSAAEYLHDAHVAGCQVLLTGEARFHSALEARSTETGLVLMGHYASERFAIEDLALVIAEQFPGLTVWASRDEANPLVRL